MSKSDDFCLKKEKSSKLGENSFKLKHSTEEDLHNEYISAILCNILICYSPLVGKKGKY